jgi:hypothetical protein
MLCLDATQPFEALSVGGDAEVLNMTCTIFDRWSNILHQTSTLPVSWKGMQHEKPCIPGDFVNVSLITYRKDSHELAE